MHRAFVAERSCGAAECKDLDPPFEGYDAGCYWTRQRGKCNDAVLRRVEGASDAVREAGGYCGATCGTCPQPRPTCSNLSPDRQPCAAHRRAGRCAEEAFAEENFCEVRCGADISMSYNTDNRACAPSLTCRAHNSV